MIDEGKAVLRVRTPEGVSFSFALASPVMRLAAWAIDQAAILAAWSAISALIGILEVVNGDLARGLMAAGYFVLSTGYGMVLEWHWEGQTLGKRVMQLRVMDEIARPLRAAQVVVRNLLRSVDALPIAYLVGGVAALLSTKAQRLGDMAAATIVVHDGAIYGGDPAKLVMPRFNSLRDQRHLAARLRANTSPALAHAALQALFRREELEPAARVDLFRDFAAHFRQLAPLPPELEEGISDEQYVWNVVEVLFGTAVPVAKGPPHAAGGGIPRAVNSG